ncbi:MAG: glycosyltransferase family 4 protein [Bacteroidia bacterium]|nr:glycosyltransferase family 4 protein [Bacteroidia bacterium]
MQLHIVSLDNPYPPNYGGAIELWGKLEPLWNAGVEIHLHSFHKPDRAFVSDKLRSFCQRIYLYPRQTGVLSWLSWLPYAVQSRQNPQLIANITQEPAPILMDGIHSTFYLPELRKKFPNLPIAIRMHNREMTYYRELSQSESNPLKKLFFCIETRKFSWYEPFILKQADFVFCISPEEQNWVKQFQPANIWLPAFSPFYPPQSVQFPLQSLKRILFVANFSIQENQKAGQWLLNEIIPQLDLTFEWTFAGKNPVWKSNANFYVVANPDSIQPLIQANDLVLVISFQRSGTKLKLLEAIASGKPFLTTPEAWYGSGMYFPEVCFTDAVSFQNKLKQLQSGELDSVYSEITKQYLQLYNPHKNAQELILRIFQINRPVI